MTEDATPGRPRGRVNLSTGRGWDPAVFAIPLAILMFVIFFVPIVWFFAKTFLEMGGGFFGVVSRIWTVLNSSTIRGVIVTTNWISLVVTLSALIIAYPIAYRMTRSSGFSLTILVMCVVLPYFTSVVVRTYSWMVILGRQGLVNTTLIRLGIIEEPLSLMYNTFAVVVGMTYVLLPYLVLTLYAVMKGIDPSLIRAARSLGAGGFYIFRRIYLPLTLHGIFSGCLIVFILAIGFFITPALMGGPDTMMIAMLIEREVELTLNWPLAAIMSLFLLAVTLVLYVVYYRFANIERMMG